MIEARIIAPLRIADAPVPLRSAISARRALRRFPPTRLLVRPAGAQPAALAADCLLCCAPVDGSILDEPCCAVIGSAP
jgi:hypothetical protein